MSKINILDSSVYNLISAGEVVERPASVVKELVENSIDAGAKNIKIEIIDGGIKQIKVSDDGSGIEKEYLKAAFLPHATSKIKVAADLDNILSLGFRGEALASICAVSNVKLTSKTRDSELASTISLSAGKVKSIDDIAGANGTTIVVSDLFFNVPARAKFLKKPQSEQQEITNLVSRFILANPNLKISYYADGKQILSSAGTTLYDAMYAVYGKDAITQTLDVSAKTDSIQVSGYIGKPSFSKPNRTYQTIVLNGRYINNATISTAVTNAYGEMLMKRKYPFFVLNVVVDPKMVDVNVHPNKMEVRFETGSKIFSVVFDAVSRALSEMDYILSVDTDTGEVVKNSGNTVLANIAEPKPQDVHISYTQVAPKNVDKLGVNLNPFSNIGRNDQEDTTLAKSKVIASTIGSNTSYSLAADNFGLGSKLLEELAKVETKQQEIESEEYFSTKIKVVGKIFNTYIVVEYGDNIYFFDQHAAHERVLYEKFKTELDTGKLIIQPLMFPYILTVNASEYSMICSSMHEMKKLGIDIEEFGDNSFKISAVPLILSNINFDSFFSSFLTDVSNIPTKNSDIIKEKLMQHSCKSAIKAGNNLSNMEIETLFKYMNDEQIPLFCPHGRPIAVRVTKKEIEKWFKRIV